MASCRIGIDVGGTFTDFALVDLGTGAMTTWKEPSRPADPAAAIGAGLAPLLAKAGRARDAVELVVHGTTLALNAILESRVGRVGLAVSAGFGDMLVIGRGDLPNPFNYKAPKRVPPIPRERVYEIPARLRPDGSVVARPAAADLDRVAAAAEAEGVEALGVLVISSYAHPALEREVAVGLAQRLPGVLVTASADLWPVVREYERALTTTLNGAVHRLMGAYYGRLAGVLGEAGISAPILVTASTGGTLSIAAARERPIETLYSGPAGGVVAATRLADACDLGPVVTFDMGGTSSDLAVIADGRPPLANETRIGDDLVSIPVVDVRAIGAGGGSILWVDRQGVLKVGPQSAGADPGPIAYGRGGTEPTVTDCYLALGLIDPAFFLGGRMALDRAAALEGLGRIAATIGIDGPDAPLRAAESALRIATVRMSAEIFKRMAERGLDPRDFTLLAFGGAGPTQAALLAAEARLPRIAIPPDPGTFCALGALLAPVRRDFARSRRVALGLDAEAGAAVRDTIAALADEARAWIAREGAAGGRITLHAAADMQYPRTATETTVAVPEEVWRSGDAAALAELFHREHERIYTFRDAASPVEVSTLRLTVRGEDPPLALARRPEAQGPPAAIATRRVYAGARWRDVPVHSGPDLAAGHVLAGPAIVEMPSSTAWIAPGWRARVDAFGCLHLSGGGHRMSAGLDPITLEILSARIAAAAEEMALTLKRTARSLYVKEAIDFGVALVALDGRFFGIPRGYGSSLIDQSILPTLEALDEPLEDGDVVLTNHPYLSAGLVSHTPDLTLIRPYFAEGRLICYGYDFIHSTDVGGRVPSSISPTNTEIFQEGLLLPPVKLVRRGAIVRDILRIYTANVRTPDLNRHDLTAMLAALESGRRRVEDLVRLHGADTIVAAQGALMAYAAAKARDVLRRIPDGSHDFWDYLDDDAVSPVPVRFRVRMTAKDGAIRLDFSGTDPQSAGACNLPTLGRRHAWLTVRILQFVTTHDPTVPLNGGIFDSVSIVTPRGSVIDPEFPAPTGVRHASAYRLNDAIVGAFARAVPRDVPAPSGGAMVPVVLAEHDRRTGKRNVLVLNSIIVGSGARYGSDGHDGVDGSISTIRNTPAEKSELEAAVDILAYGLNPDSAGAGRWRGGLGLVFTFRVLQSGSQVLGRGLERFFFRPWGVAGGQPGKAMRVVRNLGTKQAEDLGKIDVVDLAEGDTMTFLTPGGGGWGDPFLRDPVAVLADVRAGFVSAGAAREDYGVAILDGRIDEDATRSLRAARPIVAEDAPLTFAFGARRRAWDAIFGDADMAALNALLMRLPAPQRHAARRDVFARVLPGLFDRATRWSDTLFAAPAAARERLGKEIAALAHRLGRA